MAIHKLYIANAVRDLSSLPANFSEQQQKRNKDKDGLHPNNTSGYSTLHRDVTKALLYNMGYYTGSAIVEVTPQSWAAERKLSDGTHEIASYSLQSGELRVAKISATGRYSAFKTIGAATDDVDLTIAFMAILPAIFGENLECVEKMALIVDKMKTLSTINAEDKEWWYLNDAFESLISSGIVPVNIPNDGNIGLLSSRTVKSGALNGNVLSGQIDILAGNSAVLKSKGADLTMKEAKAEFSKFSKEHDNWTEEEKMLIPQFPDDYKVMPEALKFARRYINTSEDIRPMRNFLWRGITSYGKSTGVEQIACMLNLPLVRMTCSSDMERKDFLSDLIPDTSAVSTDNLPDFETIMYDPEGAYYTLTGIKDENATSDMCLKAYGEAVAKNSSSVPKFKFIEADYVKALTRGYICEVQECSRIKDSGVLVGLNEYDRPDAIIPLVDGSHKKRHKDAMVIYTDNTGYVSCRPMCPSVIRRMDFAVVSNELSKKQVIERIKYNTKYDDTEIIDKCYLLWKDIQKFCKEHDITEGPVSVTELERLVQSVKYDGLMNIRENVIECIVNKASSDEEEINDIIQCIDVNNHGLWMS